MASHQCHEVTACECVRRQHMQQQQHQQHCNCFYDAINFADDDDDGDNLSLPPYPDVFDSAARDYVTGNSEFPKTPVPAQIGVVRPIISPKDKPDEPLRTSHFDAKLSLRGRSAAQQLSPKSAAKIEAEVEELAKRHALMRLQQKYETLGKVRSDATVASEASAAPRGYTQMTQATTSRHEARSELPGNNDAMFRAQTLQHVPCRTSSLPRSRHDVTEADVASASRTMGRAPKFSDILRIHSPARSFSNSMDSQYPDLQALLSHDFTLKPEVREDVTPPQPSTKMMPQASSQREPDDRSIKTKEERDDVTKPKPQATSACECPSPLLSEHELLQVDIFYRSHTSKVFVSRSAAHMYFGSVRSMSRSVDDACATHGGVSTSHWHAVKSGVPLLLLDGVGTSERRLHLVFAERGTGFALWRDVLSHASKYNALLPDLHTLHWSRDTAQLVAFKFFDRQGAKDFFQKFHTVITHPEYEDVLIANTKKKKVAKTSSGGRKAKLPNKAAISGPCCFTHITSLDREIPDEPK